MFKYISKILAQFSTPQKIVALSMLLLAIVIISIAPSFISSITLDRDELDSEIKKQDVKIEKLESDVDSLESSIRRNKKECTNQIVFREEEFLQMLDQLKSDILSNNRNPVPESSREEKVIVYKKPRLSSTISMIDEMKKKIKKN